jgi:hypothetical protein
VKRGALATEINGQGPAGISRMGQSFERTKGFGNFVPASTGSLQSAAAIQCSGYLPL